MQPGDQYEVVWDNHRVSRLLVERIINDDLVLVRKWVRSKKAWTKYGMPMQKLAVSCGQKIER